MHTFFLAAVLAASPLLLDVPFVQQKPDFCGEAVAEMGLRYLGRAVSQDDVFDASGVDPSLGRGAWTDELARALRRLGVEPGPVWYRAKPGAAAGDAQWAQLKADDAPSDEVIYHEPAEPDGANRRMARARFLQLMAFKPTAEHWTYIRLRLSPQEATALPRPETPRAPNRLPDRREASETEASRAHERRAPELCRWAQRGARERVCPAHREDRSPQQVGQPVRRSRPAAAAQHVLELRRTLPRGMTVVWERPFLVVGNEEPQTVRRRGKEVVRWTRDLLLKDFFAEAPSELEEIWVLKDAASYQRLSRELFGTNPETPYGYYLPSRHAQVMNIRPGYGTLVHEMVHPFMHHAWPDAPAWLNEGLASLFEFPFEDEGHLKGRVNWRLPALQQGLAAGRVASFSSLAHFSQDEFYEDVDGTHYAAARYLCHWLQEKGALTTLVRRAIELKAEDPSGFRALGEALGGEPDTLRAEWERYVQRLSRRGR